MTINVGFDFGTSSTKVCIYDFQSEQHHFVVFNNKENGLKRYCYPSIIYVCGNKIYFSEKHFSKPISLFKIQIMESPYKPDPRYYKPKISGFQIIVLYCAHVIRLVKNFLAEKYPKANLIFQFGIPIDHLSTDFKHNEKERQFRLAFNIAEILSSQNITIEGINLDKALQIIKKVENEYIKNYLFHNKVEIYPETMAGIAALLKDHLLPDYVRYSIIDIGAGTTDISFFEFSQNMHQDGKFHIYFSKTCNIGAENFGSIESAKDKIFKNFKNGFGNAYHLCPEKWKDNFKILFLGGGSRNDLRTAYKNSDLTIPGMNGHRHLIEPKETDFPVPFDAYDSFDKNNTSWKDIFDFLAISYGLSFPNPLMPKYNPQVPPRQKSQIEQTPFEPLTPDVG